MQDGLRPIRPYRWKIDGSSEGLIEIPVTTMPIFRIPFHASYVLFIYRFSPWLALTYFRLAMLLCKLTRTRPSLLLHPLDFLGGNDIKELSFFPAMDVHSDKKIKLVNELVDIYSGHFSIVPLHQYARTIAQKNNLKMHQPKFTVYPENPENNN